MKLSLFSVSYAGLWGQESLCLPAFVEKAAQLGFDSVMLMGKRPHLSPLDVTSERIAVLKESLQKNGITCDVIGAYTDFSPMAAAEIPYFEMQIAHIEWSPDRGDCSELRFYGSHRSQSGER